MRRGKLSLKQIFSIVAAFVVIYLVSANHKALRDWFAPAQPPAAKAAANAPAKAKEVRATQ